MSPAAMSADQAVVMGPLVDRARPMSKVPMSSMRMISRYMCVMVVCLVGLVSAPSAHGAFGDAFGVADINQSVTAVQSRRWVARLCQLSLLLAGSVRGVAR
jgi:hypothetical protein